MKIKNLLLVAIFSLLFVNPSFAAESTVNGETQFVFNTLLFLICGFLVMFMAPGFAMLVSLRLLQKILVYILSLELCFGFVDIT